jgi:hypothetical protein
VDQLLLFLQEKDLVKLELCPLQIHLWFHNQQALDHLAHLVVQVCVQTQSFAQNVEQKLRNFF